MLKVLNKIAGLSAATLPILALTAMAAHAQPVSIKVSDLNLSSPSYATTLSQRIDRAADQYCSSQSDERLLSRVAACKKGVRAEVVEKLSAAQQQALAGVTQLASR